MTEQWQYEVWDVYTGLAVGRKYKTRAAASRKAEAMDQEYGAHRYSVDLIRVLDPIEGQDKS